MAVPDRMIPTPQEAITVAVGCTVDAASEVWQRVTGNVFVVYTGVPFSLAQNILQSADPDGAIRTRLVGYPKRVARV